MAWAKVDDQWFAHRKVVGLSLAARGLWTTVLSWTCAQRSPKVPTHMVAFLASGADVDPLTAELVEAGLWLQVDGGWEIHDWAQYQERPSDEAKASGSYGNHVRWHVNRGAVDPECTHCTEDHRPDSPPTPPDDRPDDPGESEPDRSRPVPARPGPTRPIQEEEERATHPTWNALASKCPARQWGQVGTFGAKRRLLDALTAVEDAGWPPDRAAAALLAGDLSSARSVGAVLLSRAQTLADTHPPPLVEVVDCPHCGGGGLWWSQDGTEAARCVHPDDDRKTA